MKTILIALVLVLIIVLIAIAGYRWQPRRDGSFQDVLRNPHLLPDLGQMNRDVTERAESLSGSRARIAKLVDAFVFDAESSDDAWAEKRILGQLARTQRAKDGVTVCVHSFILTPANDTRPGFGNANPRNGISESRVV